MAVMYEDLTYGTIKRWTRGSRMKKGGMGEIFLGKNVDNGHLFLIKSVACQPSWSKQLAALQNERKILKKLSKRKCPNILRMLGSTTSDSVEEFGGKPTMDLFLEFAMPRGNLTEIVQSAGRLKEPVAKEYTFQILHTLVCMHKIKIVHSDIRGENIVVCDESVKLVGFGGAKDTTKRSMCSWLQEPEINICSRPSVPQHLIEQAIGPPPEFSEDIRALGCTVCEMVTGRRPNLDHASTVDNVIRDFEDDSSLKTMPNCLSFIKCCLKESDKASTFHWTAKRLLDHPWMRSLRFITHSDSCDGLEDGEDGTCRDPLLLPRVSPLVHSSPLTTCADLVCCRSMGCRSMYNAATFVSPTKSQFSMTRPPKKGHKLRRLLSTPTGPPS